jgi:hypothetical protein
MYVKNDGCLLGSLQHVVCTCSGILYEHAVFLFRAICWVQVDVEVMCGRQCVTCIGQFDGIRPAIAVKAEKME